MVRLGELCMVLLGGGLIGLAASTWSGPMVPGGTAGAVAEMPDAIHVVAAPDGPARTVHFGACYSGGGTNCVVDGDTFWMDGEKIRVADIDAPETHPSRCAEEDRLGTAATQRLQALLNAGPIRLAIADRDEDQYGRKLRVVMRGGVSLGNMLVDEGLARHWIGYRQPWC